MSSVKNLLAMFENKGDAKPPERGRSPGGPPAPSSAASGTESPRPLSKIRTSFVAIEKDGRVGLARDQSGGSSVSRRRMSPDTEAGAAVPPADQPVSGEREPSVSGKKMESPSPAPVRRASPRPDPSVPPPTGDPASQSLSVAEPPARIPTPKMPTPEASAAHDEAITAEAPTSLPQKDLDGKADDKEPESKPHQVEHPIEERVAPQAAVGQKETNGKPTLAQAESFRKPVEAPDALKEQKSRDKKPLGPSSSTRTKPALAPVSAGKTNAKPKKSPTTPKVTTPKSTAAGHDRRAAPAPSSGTRPQPEKARSQTQRARSSQDHESGAAARNSNTGNSSTGPSKSTTGAPVPIKKPATAHVPPPVAATSPPTTGFVKPKPKSPTKPVRLPSSLMAPTAASAHKIGTGARQTHSRTGHHPGGPVSGNTRSPSRASLGPPSAHGNASRPLRRQSSSVTRQRPSFGPPPKQVAKDHPPTRKEKEVDEGFLARMMRPTQASASKMHEKVQLPTTPPRKPQTTKRISDHGTAVPIKGMTPMKRSPASRDSTPHAGTSRRPNTSDSVGLPSPPKTSSVSKTPSVTEEADEKAVSEPEYTREEAQHAIETKSMDSGDGPVAVNDVSITKGAVANEPASAPAATDRPQPNVPAVVETMPTPVDAPETEHVKSEPAPEQKTRDEKLEASTEANLANAVADVPNETETESAETKLFTPALESPGLPKDAESPNEQSFSETVAKDAEATS